MSTRTVIVSAWGNEPAGPYPEPKSNVRVPTIWSDAPLDGSARLLPKRASAPPSLRRTASDDSADGNPEIEQGIFPLASAEVSSVRRRAIGGACGPGAPLASISE